jgi:dihydrofolate reductase
MMTAGKLLIAFTMSLDGFIAGPEISVEDPMGKGGERLHEWIFSDSADRGVDPEMAKELFDLVGAVILGRRTFDVGLAPWGDTPFPVPCFVLTHERRENLPMKSGTFAFVNDGIESALRQAKLTACGRDILVMGADAARQYLKAGLVDELILQIAPVLFGRGTRLLDGIGDDRIELRRERLAGSPFVTHLKFSVVRAREAGV